MIRPVSTSAGLFLFAGLIAAHAYADWPQAAGPNGNFQIIESSPTQWSVAAAENILWSKPLYETGQSTPVIHDGKIFYTTMKMVDADSEYGKDIIAWCCDAKTGKTIWKSEVRGKFRSRLSGCFGDNSAPAPVCYGDYVVFLNPFGRVTCFHLNGAISWTRTILSVPRTAPFEFDGLYVFTRQVYEPEDNGAFSHEHGDLPKEKWTQLSALNIETAEQVWKTNCGVNMGCTIVPQKLSDGRTVAVVGRGGGHNPPEKPDGISMVDLNDGSTVWSLPLEGFMATMSYSIRNDLLHLFHDTEHLSVDAMTGKIVRRVSISDNVQAHVWNGDGHKEVSETIKKPKNKKRLITQNSNLLVGKYHYFRSYTRPYLGRVEVETSDVEYVELPLQLATSSDGVKEFSWFDPKRTEKNSKNGKVTTVKMENQGLSPNKLENARKFVVFGDKRSQGTGWGHVAAPTPTVAGEHLYVPVQNGTVYVIDWDAQVLNFEAVVAINDLGEAGDCYTRASLSFNDGKLFAHTIKKLICVGKAK